MVKLFALYGIILLAKNNHVKAHIFAKKIYKKTFIATTIKRTLVTVFILVLAVLVYNYKTCVPNPNKIS